MEEAGITLVLWKSIKLPWAFTKTLCSQNTHRPLLGRDFCETADLLKAHVAQCPIQHTEGSLDTVCVQVQLSPTTYKENLFKKQLRLD